MRLRSAAAFGVSCALHLLLAALLAGVPRPVLAPVAAPRGKTVSVFIVPPTEDAVYKGLNPVDRRESEWTLPPGDGPETIRIGELDIDVGRIRARAQVLFPFLTPGLSLDHFLRPARDDMRKSLENPFATARRREAAAALKPLSMNDAEVQSLVDTAWSRGDRWASFEPIGRLVQAHSPSEGQVPRLIQSYTDQNALQPYADTDNRDPRLWAQLGLAADHVTFIEFIRRYAAAYPSTRATTELLFLLDRVAEANRDALRVMRDSDPAEVLSWTRQANPGAYRLINRIRAYYQVELDRRGLQSEAAIDRYYTKARLAILQGIARTTPGGYRANDARFIAGALLWREGDTKTAVTLWREMTPGQDGSHLPAGPQVAEAMRRAGLPAGPAFHREIDRILKNDLGRWLMFSQERLGRFGYRFDSF